MASIISRYNINFTANQNSNNYINFTGVSKHPENTNNSRDVIAISYVKDNKNDIFLRDYLLKVIAQKGIKKSDGIRIDVYAPDIEENPNHGFSELAYGPFSGYVEDFFALMHDDKKTFQNRLKLIKNNKEVAAKLDNLYNYLDNYYKLELTLKSSGKSYNLLNLSEEGKKELMDTASSEEKPFVEEAIKNIPKLNNLAFKFSRAEVKRKTLSVAGEDSRDFITTLLVGIGASFLLDNFLKTPMINLVGGEETLIGNKLSKITEFVTGVGDDTLACIKDYKQDKVSIGEPAATAAFVSSEVLALGAGFFVLDKFPIQTMKGAIGYSIVSSIGSIWSNLFAFGLMQKRQKGMKDNGLIVTKKNESSVAKTWKNYIAYDAYIGKVIGILSCVPIAMFAQKKGYLAKNGKDFVKPLLSSVWLVLIGSGETLITSLIQAARDIYRKSKIDTSKEMIMKDVDKAESFNLDDYTVKGTSFLDYQENFIKDVFHPKHKKSEKHHKK